MITRDTINRIMDAVRIEEVVGDFLTLRRRGANMLANCPFHNEKTPSFTVSPAKGIYKCFGCGASGNSVNFIMEHEHITYPDALRFLAKKYNIEIEETEAPSEQDQEERKLEESIYIANSFAQKYYTDQLLHTEAGQSIGLSYFKERGFTMDTIEKFQLGYAPDSPDSLTKAAVAAGYQLDVLKKAGLTSDKYDKEFDFFRDRVQFTIHNFSGKVVGFGGRTLKSDKKIPKYVNTHETEVYNKSKILYGLFFGKNAVRKQDECILVEGYTDVISLFQAGIENVVASSGTSLTVEQIRLIKRLTHNITILYDGDAAGIKAALRGIDLVLEEDMNVKVVLLPPEDDPDSYVKNHGAAAFQQYKEDHQEDFILFKASYLLKDVQHDPVKKSEAIKDIVHSISLVPDTIKRSLYVRECSELFGMAEQILVSEVNKERRKKLAKTTNTPHEELEPLASQDGEPEHEQTEQPAFTVARGLERQEKEIIRLLLEFGEVPFNDEGVLTAQIVLHELEAGPNLHFADPACDQVLWEYINALAQGRPVPHAKYFLDHESPTMSQLAIELLHSPYDISENWDKMHNIMLTPRHMILKRDIISTLCRYKLLQLDQLVKNNREAVIAAQTDQDDTKLMELLTLQRQYDEARKALGSVLGTVITKL